jgi:subtilisin family serine protease
VYRVEVPVGIRTNDLIADLNADPHVAYAQLNHGMDLDQAFVPDDPLFSSFGSWGQTFRDLWGPDRIHVPEVWSRSQGEGTVVAVVDTGLDALHPDIVGNVWINEGEDLDGDGIAGPADRNGIDDDGNGFIDDLTGFDFANSIDTDADGFYAGPEDVSDSDPFDDNGHGSHVAGTIAAVGDNGIGIIGIAPKSKLMALKGFRAEGSASDIVLWRAVLYAAEMGATVINNSWSCGTPCPENPLAEDVLTLVDALGTVVVTSAGNSADDVLFRSPESGDHVISVGALGVDDRLASFSNRGWLMDVVAPGGGPNEASSVLVARRNILSLLSSGAPSFRSFFAVGDEYLRFSGTSMSAPHVAGAVAILRSLRPELSPSDVRRLIRMSSEDLGLEGHDSRFGAGVLDVARLVDTELPDLTLSIAAPSPGTLHDPGSGALRLLGRADGGDLAELEIEVGSGLNARSFEPVASFGDSVARSSSQADLGEGVLALWDTSKVPDGPYVLRVIARLHDGRRVEEHTVVGIERNTPIRISKGDRAADRPKLSGRQVVWQVKESEVKSNGITLNDLEIGFFPERSRDRTSLTRNRITSIDLEGEQRNPVFKGREIAWEEHVGSRVTLERCRLERGATRCEPTPVSTEAGRFFELRIGRDWLVWMRFNEGMSRLEGCRIGPSVDACVPRPLIAPEAGDGWTLSSFDGDTLFVRRGFSERARCRLTAEEGLCRPEVVAFSEDSPSPAELVHDGNLVAFKTLRLESRLPPGCEGRDSENDCIFELVPVVQIYACWIGQADPVCDPVPITDSVPDVSLLGMAVSRNRVTWSIAPGDDRAAIHFCQFVPETQECVDQRLSGAPAQQGYPSIDSNRIVWEDRRLGEIGIFGIELPSLVSPRRVKATAGKLFRIPLRGIAGTGGALRFEVEAIEGFTPEDANARFVSTSLNSDFVVLSGSVPPNAASKALWTVRAIGAGGLFTDRILEISADP